MNECVQKSNRYLLDGLFNGPNKHFVSFQVSGGLFKTRRFSISWIKYLIKTTRCQELGASLCTLCGKRVWSVHRGARAKNNNWKSTLV